ncbi:MAG: RNA polymerase sigma-70 factor [Bacteroidales bacterium]|nr:RNA polymerase sigma-70 factor [Bacteroidales bacterium]
MSKRELEIIELIQSGDEAGLRQLFDLYYTPLCVYALKYIDGFDEVEDLVQEVFVSFWESKKALDIKTSVKSYLFRAVKNNALNYLRKAKRFHHEQIDEQFESHEDIIEDEEAIEVRKQQLYKEIELLSPQAKVVFESIVFSNMKYKEVAEELDISVNTVKTTFSRALKRLRNSLDIIVILMLP